MTTTNKTLIRRIRLILHLTDFKTIHPYHAIYLSLIANVVGKIIGIIMPDNVTTVINKWLVVVGFKRYMKEGVL